MLSGVRKKQITKGRGRAQSRVRPDVPPKPNFRKMKILSSPVYKRPLSFAIAQTAKVPNLAPARTLAALPFRSLPESPERFHLQTPNTDNSCDDDKTEPYALLPRHNLFSLHSGSLNS